LEAQFAITTCWYLNNMFNKTIVRHNITKKAMFASHLHT